MFEKASRLALRFDTIRGQVTVEDLWNIPLLGNGLNLDDIARGLSKQLKELETESFVVKANKGDDILRLRFDIVKHIIDIKLTEAEAAENRKAASDKNQKIRAIIAQKKDATLMEASVEDLEKMLSE